MITRKGYIMMLQSSCQKIIDEADRLMPDLDQTVQAEFIIRLNPECLPEIEVRRKLYDLYFPEETGERVVG